MPNSRSGSDAIRKPGKTSAGASPATSTASIATRKPSTASPAISRTPPASSRRDIRIDRSGEVVGSRPASLQQLPRLVDRDPPQRQHVLVGALVETAEIAVADAFAHPHRIQVPQAIDGHHRLRRARWRHIADPGPWKTFHPRGVARHRVDLDDLGPGPGRVPPIVKADADAR